MERVHTNPCNGSMKGILQCWLDQKKLRRSSNLALEQKKNFWTGHGTIWWLRTDTDLTNDSVYTPSICPMMHHQAELDRAMVGDLSNQSTQVPIAVEENLYFFLDVMCCSMPNGRNNWEPSHTKRSCSNNRMVQLWCVAESQPKFGKLWILKNGLVVVHPVSDVARIQGLARLRARSHAYLPEMSEKQW